MSLIILSTNMLVITTSLRLPSTQLGPIVISQLLVGSKRESKPPLLSLSSLHQLINHSKNLLKFFSKQSKDRFLFWLYQFLITIIINLLHILIKNHYGLGSKEFKIYWRHQSCAHRFFIARKFCEEFEEIIRRV